MTDKEIKQEFSNVVFLIVLSTITQMILNVFLFLWSHGL